MISPFLPAYLKGLSTTRHTVQCIHQSTHNRALAQPIMQAQCIYHKRPRVQCLYRKPTEQHTCMVARAACLSGLRALRMKLVSSTATGSSTPAPAKSTGRGEAAMVPNARTAVRRVISLRRRSRRTCSTEGSCAWCVLSGVCVWCLFCGVCGCENVTYVSVCVVLL
jgi:hypothetical protein